MLLEGIRLVDFGVAIVRRTVWLLEYEVSDVKFVDANIVFCMVMTLGVE